MNKKHTIIMLAALVLTLVMGTGATYAQGPKGPQTPGTGLPAAAAGPLPDAVVTAIKAGLMDEYHAYNVYQAVIDQFGKVRPFTNIQRAEAQHINAWKVIFNRYGVTIPAAPTLNPVPKFTTLTKACQAAIDAETANFKLYDEMLNTASAYPDIVQVITRLRDASQYNHLPAFSRCAGL
ncbi:MAG: hypothetical protein IT324_26310 [Anaerolineae bacterium]|nr:hypothetical protein [Anaerolineae bacterium]